MPWITAATPSIRRSARQVLCALCVESFNTTDMAKNRSLAKAVSDADGSRLAPSSVTRQCARGDARALPRRVENIGRLMVLAAAVVVSIIAVVTSEKVVRPMPLC